MIGQLGEELDDIAEIQHLNLRKTKQILNNSEPRTCFTKVSHKFLTFPVCNADTVSQNINLQRDLVPQYAENDESDRVQSLQMVPALLINIAFLQMVPLNPFLCYIN